MKRQTIEEVLKVIFFTICIIAIIFAIVWRATSDEYWYADMHDDNCEQMIEGSETCDCYSRFIKKDKNR